MRDKMEMRALWRRGWPGIWLGVVLALVATLGTTTAASAKGPGCPITVIDSGGPGSVSVGGPLIETGFITSGSSTVGQPSVPAEVVLTGVSPDPSVASFSATTYTLRFVVRPGQTVNFSEDLGPAPQAPGNYEGQVNFTFGGACKDLFSDQSFGVVVTG